MKIVVSTFLIASLFASTASPVRAGLYYSGEKLSPLPSQWRGFLLDHRALRMIGFEPAAGAEFNPLRAQYESALKDLETTAKTRELNADEIADRGAILVRLGQASKAVELLRGARRMHPNSFRIAANLATAWQLLGDDNEAAKAQREAVRLAPTDVKAIEELHLKLIEFRRDNPKSTTLDRLFGDQKPDAKSVAALQQLALWLPTDARLIWQLAEATHAMGDVRSAASLMDTAVVELAFTALAARDARRKFRDAADEIAKLPDSEHAKYRGTLTFQSSRPLLRRTPPASLPDIRDNGTNSLLWSVVGETIIEKPFRPKVHDYLKKLDGKTISITGYMQALTTDIELGGFMLIEFPVGCWFCETPEVAGIIYVQMPASKATTLKRTRVKVSGVLKLNDSDPEDFLYAIRDAKVGDPD
jgi:hypothetical protein